MSIFCYKLGNAIEEMTSRLSILSDVADPREMSCLILNDQAKQCAQVGTAPKHALSLYDYVDIDLVVMENSNEFLLAYLDATHRAVLAINPHIAKHLIHGDTIEDVCAKGGFLIINIKE